MFCDLHMHSTASDGTVAPEALGALAAKAGLGAIALTDHDTTAGLEACAKGCRRAKVAFVPGIEISCDPGEAAGEMHILGYFIDPQNKTLGELLAKQEAARTGRVPKIVKRLDELGLDVTLDEVQSAAAGAMVGRPHIARVLIDKGYARTVQDAFVRYLGDQAPAFVPKQRANTQQAIDAIHSAGGLACLAHAVQVRCADDAELTHLVAQLAERGLDSLEAWHDDHSPAMVDKCRRMAERFGLLVTGGSDFHGEAKSVQLGSQRVPYDVYEQLAAQRAKAL